MFGMVSAVMFGVGAIIAYIEGEKELNYKYNRGINNNGKNQKKHGKKAI
jgi:hypothetical protein